MSASPAHLTPNSTLSVLGSHGDGSTNLTEDERASRVRKAADARARALVEGDASTLERLLHEAFRMPVTQTWVRDEAGWRCLAGHAGPRRTSGAG